MSTLRAVIESTLYAAPFVVEDRAHAGDDDLLALAEALEGAVSAWWDGALRPPSLADLFTSPVAVEHNRRVAQGQARREPGF